MGASAGISTITANIGCAKSPKGALSAMDFGARLALLRCVCSSSGCVFRPTGSHAHVVNNSVIYFGCFIQAPICLETALQRKNAESFTEGLAGLKNSDGVKGKGALDCPVLITYGG